MTNFLLRRFVPNYRQLEDPLVRGSALHLSVFSLTRKTIQNNKKQQ